MHWGHKAQRPKRWMAGAIQAQRPQRWCGAIQAQRAKGDGHRGKKAKEAALLKP